MDAMRAPPGIGKRKPGILFAESRLTTGSGVAVDVLHRKGHTVGQTVSTRSISLVVLLVGMISLTAAGGCSVKRYAVNTVGDLLASGDSVYESDGDIVLVGEALPFSLKLVESLLAESPDHHGLLLTATRGFVLYSYAYVHYQAEQWAIDDLSRARVHRKRAQRLYLRALGYAMRAWELDYRGFPQKLYTNPESAVQIVGDRAMERTVPLLYWTAAALGLAISVSKDDATLLARLPEVEALLERAMELNEGWDYGALHEFKLVLAASRPLRGEPAALRHHYDRALALSHGQRASVYVAYAEAVSVQDQNRSDFITLLNKALAINPDAVPARRLTNLIAQRRARWLLDRIDDLFL